MGIAIAVKFNAALNANKPVNGFSVYGFRVGIPPFQAATVRAEFAWFCFGIFIKQNPAPQAYSFGVDFGGGNTAKVIPPAIGFDGVF